MTEDRYPFEFKDRKAPGLKPPDPPVVLVVRPAGNGRAGSDSPKTHKRAGRE